MPRITVLLLALAVLAVPATAAADVRGELTPVAGTAGCITSTGASEDGAATCATGSGFDGPTQVLVAPDGRHAYVAAYGMGGRDDTVAAFSLDGLSGAATQLAAPAGCLTPTGLFTGATCAKARGIGTGDGDGMAMTKDGRFLYAAAQSTRSLAVLARDPATGVLTQLPGTAGCLSSNGSSDDGPGTCTTYANFEDPAVAELSPDERFLYVHDYGNTREGIFAFARDTATGALTPVPGPGGCVTRGPVAGCEDIRHHVNAGQIAVLERHIYAPSYSGAGGFVVLDRDPATGGMTQKPGQDGCVTDDGTSSDDGPGTCRTGIAVGGTWTATADPEGRRLYVGAYTDDALSAWSIGPGGVPTQLPPGSGGCAMEPPATEGCAAARGLDGAYAMALGPEGRTLHTTGYDADAVGVFSLDPATGAPSPLAGTAGCVSLTGSSGACADGRALDGTYSVTLSPDGGTAYVAAYSSRGFSIYRRQAAPVCRDAAVSATVGQPVAVPLACADPNGDPVTRTVMTAPSDGTLGAVDDAAGSVSYVPAAAGTRTLAFRGDDGRGPGLGATVMITVAAPPPPPPVPSVALPDTTRPSCTAAAVRVRGAAARRSGVAVRLRCTEPVTARATLTLAARDARRLGLTRRSTGSRITVASGRTGRSTATPTVRVTLTAKARRALTKLRRGTLRARLTVTVRDAAGTTATRTVVVTIRA